MKTPLKLLKVEVPGDVAPVWECAPTDLPPDTITFSFQELADFAEAVGVLPLQPIETFLTRVVKKLRPTVEDLMRVYNSQEVDTLVRETLAQNRKRKSGEHWQHTGRR